jgi:hypothetical protein
MLDLRTEKYAKNLAELIKIETISINKEMDKSKR